MARTLITPQSLGSGGVEPTFTAAIADGHKVPNNGRMILYVKNADAASRTITVKTPGSVDGNLAIPDRDVAVPAGEERVIGPLDTGVYNMRDDADAVTEREMVYVDYSATANVTIAALKIA